MQKYRIAFAAKFLQYTVGVQGFVSRISEMLFGTWGSGLVGVADLMYERLWNRHIDLRVEYFYLMNLTKCIKVFLDSLVIEEA